MDRHRKVYHHQILISHCVKQCLLLTYSALRACFETGIPHLISCPKCVYMTAGTKVLVCASDVRTKWDDKIKTEIRETLKQVV